MKAPIFMTVIAILATNLAPARAIQQPSPRGQNTSPTQGDDDTITIDAALVNTYVSVRDKSGHSVPGLTKDDFAVLDEGKEQPIIYFSQESNQPLQLALVVDRSRSVEKEMGLTQDMARDFFSSPRPSCSCWPWSLSPMVCSDTR